MGQQRLKVMMIPQQEVEEETEKVEATLETTGRTDAVRGDHKKYLNNL